MESWFPTGTSLDQQSFAQRHRVVLWLVWAHLPLLGLYGLARGVRADHLAADLVPLALFATTATSSRRRVTQTMFAAAALLTASGVAIHLSGGLIEAHIHVYVSLVLVSLYVDWRPYAVAIVAVLVHHLGVGLLAPSTVFAHAAGQRSPLLWALLHTAFVGAESLICLLIWRFTTLQHERLTQAVEEAAAAAVARQRSDYERAVARLEQAEALAHELRGRQLVQRTMETRADELSEVSARLRAAVESVNTGIDEITSTVFGIGPTGSTGDPDPSKAVSP